MRTGHGSLSVLAAVALCGVTLAEPKPSAPSAPPQASQPSVQPAGQPAAQPAGPRARMLNDADRARAIEIIRKAEAFLRSKQDQESGGWSLPKPGADGKTPPQLPGISALVLMGMAMDPAPGEAAQQSIALGTKYLLNLAQPDGGIYDGLLPSYNTALAVSALSRIKTPQAQDAVRRGVEFLKKLQWSEDSDPSLGGNEAAKPITREHPFYGGVGYGRHGRPDNSNLNIFMQAMQDAGVSADDPAVQRALVFLQRTQMDERINDMPYAKGSRQGGFVYATAENAQSVDGRAGQSMAGTIEETLSDGTKASRLRAYGSMTYAGFKSYLYANLPRTDRRVAAAYDWIRSNYTVEENPGLGTDGMYYYYVVLARALRAWGEPTIPTLNSAGEPAGDKRWAEDLLNRLAGLQQDDGSFKSVDDRWMENDPVLITAYAVVALRHCVQ